MQAQKTVDWDRLLCHFDVPVFGERAREYVKEILIPGQAIWDYTTQTNAQISMERGFDVRFEGLTFRALNIARCNSLTFTAALKPHHDGCLAYFFNGKKWRFSLYGVEHKNHLDLSLIAVKYGGGGHKQSCGFEMDHLPKIFGGT
jgi:hypothetical protein